jgi:Fic family protein
LRGKNRVAEKRLIDHFGFSGGRPIPMIYSVTPQHESSSTSAVSWKPVYAISHRLLSTMRDIGEALGEIKVRSTLQFSRRSQQIHTQATICFDETCAPAVVDEMMDFVNTIVPGIDPVIQAGIFHFYMFHRYSDQPEIEKINWMITHRLLNNADPDGFALLNLEHACRSEAERYYSLLGYLGEAPAADSHVDCSEWLEFFAESLLRELRRIVEQYLRRRDCPVLEPHLRRIIDYLERCGSVSLRDYSMISLRSLSALQIDFDNLLRLGLIESMGRGQGCYYVLAEVS